MKKVKPRWGYFSKGEWSLWGASVLLILISFCMFDRENLLTLAASLVGATSLIFIARGNPIGQMLMVVFSVLYGVISFAFSYYGEMITYLGMTAPMAVFALISWLKHPYNGNRAQVKVNRLTGREILGMLLLSGAVTGVFYWILKAFDTAHLGISTVSVTTSFIAVYLTFRRSAYYALAYAANDGVLIVLWLLAAGENAAYLSVVSCFLMFLANDVYGFISWRRMSRHQQMSCARCEAA